MKKTQNTEKEVKTYNSKKRQEFYWDESEDTIYQSSKVENYLSL